MGIKRDHGFGSGSVFPWRLHDLRIGHRDTLRGAPENNGRIGLSHRAEIEEFCRRVTFGTLAQIRVRVREWKTEYNELHPHLALKGKTPTGAVV